MIDFQNLDELVRRGTTAPQGSVPTAVPALDAGMAAVRRLAETAAHDIRRADIRTLKGGAKAYDRTRHLRRVLGDGAENLPRAVVIGLLARGVCLARDRNLRMGMKQCLLAERLARRRDHATAKLSAADRLVLA